MQTKTKILFIGDPLSSLKLASDTSIAFCEAALNLNFEVFWCEKKDISFVDYEICVNRACLITQASTDAVKYTDFVGHTHKTQYGKRFLSFSEFTYCFIRPDPPFDEFYKDLCWILNTQIKVKIYNAPSALLNFHEKSLPWRAFSEGTLKQHNLIPTCLCESIEIAQKFLTAQQQAGVQKFVTKPWLGYAGADVMMWDKVDDLLQHVRASAHRLMVQPLLDEISVVGDRRVFMVNGKVAWSFVRIPPKDDIVSNLAHGGTGVLRDMTPEQNELCKKLGQFLVRHSISIAGIDMIGEKIGEINITSPTGLRAYEKLTGEKMSQKVFEALLDPAVKPRDDTRI